MPNMRQPVRRTRAASTRAWFAAACGSGLLALSGRPALAKIVLDETKLPPAATAQVDFARDIKPIFDTSCIRCHGPEKPKSHFRLDNREAALQGGDDGVDIIPGQGAKSPLVHYVAYLIEDMEMPPPEKGQQLTPEQVGLLRAWVDQGAHWDAAAPTNNFLFLSSLTLRGTAVSGDAAKFREHYWQPDGMNGGAEHFEWVQQVDANTKVITTGHALRDDYKVEVAAERTEKGFIHAGWEQYRKYYDDTGGYRPATTPEVPDLGRDLFLDIGKAWVDFGLTLPNWPRMVLGYEYDYRNGSEGTTAWSGTGTGNNARNIVPSTQDVREGVHILKFDLDADVHGWLIEDRFRGEFYHDSTHYTNSAARGGVVQNVHQSDDYFSGANTIRVERKLRDWWLASAGYFYSHLDSEATFADATTFQGAVYAASVPNITLERESHLFNVNSFFGPFSGLTISAGVQSEWTREHGFGNGVLNVIPYTFLSPADLATNAATLISDHDENDVSEKVELRYTKIPFTVLFAEARVKEQSIGQSDSDLQPSGSYLDNIDYTSLASDLRVGFDTSPWKMVSLSGHYRRTDEDADYHNNQPPVPAGGYPGFINKRSQLTDEVEARLVLRPVRWFKTTLSYQFRKSDAHTDTHIASNTVPALIYSPGGDILAGRSDAQIYSLGTTFIPTRRLYLDTTFSYQTTGITTANNGAPTIVPYRGDIYSVIFSGSFVLSQNADLFASYAFSRANYGQDNFAAGLPLGLEYDQHAMQVGVTRRFGKVTTQLRYAFYHYDEPSNDGAANYDAHSIFGTVSFKLP